MDRELIRRALLSAAFVLAAVGTALVAHSSNAMLKLIVNFQGNVNTCSVTTYKGPGDVLASAFGWWGFRAYSAATVCTNAMTIIRASDSTTHNITTDANGNLDTATITTFCNATTCTLTKLFDQSGNSLDMVNGVGGASVLGPDVTLNCINTSLPCMSTAATHFGLNTSSFPGTHAQPIFVSTVVNRVSGTTSFQDYFSAFDAGSNPNGPIVGSVNSTNTCRLYSGTAQNFTCSDSAWHNFNALFSGASSVINIDGSEPALGGSTGTGGTVNNKLLYFQFQNGGGADANGIKQTEAGIWAANPSSTVRNNMCHNQFAYWGTSTSC